MERAILRCLSQAINLIHIWQSELASSYFLLRSIVFMIAQGKDRMGNDLVGEGEREGEGALGQR